eukprot:jgi/Chlat1/4168/Chrsp27S04269
MSAAGEIGSSQAPGQREQAPLLPGRSDQDGNAAAAAAASSDDDDDNMDGDRNAAGGRSGSFARRNANIQRVRSNAGEHISDRQRSVRNSRVFLSIEMCFKIIQASICVVVLWMSREEQPDVPLRAWVAGYGLHCVLSLPWLWYRLEHSADYRLDGERINPYQPGDRLGVTLDKMKVLLEIFHTAWFLVGNVWVYSSTSSSEQAPQLYRLSVLLLVLGYLSFALPLLLCVAICCCLPCVIVLLASMEDPMAGKGAPESVIKTLETTHYKSHGEGVGGLVGEQNLSAEDAVCSICLGDYEDGVELRILPCSHSFHVGCVDTWLKINACCPLCKADIVRSGEDERPSLDPVNNV